MKNEVKKIGSIESADDSIQGNPETCKQSNAMLNYEIKNSVTC